MRQLVISEGPDIIQVGHESCERLLPLPRDLASLKKSIPGRKICLLTPIVTDVGIARLRMLAKVLRSSDEIVVNDLGALAMLNRHFAVQLIIGRLLGRMLFLSIKDVSPDRVALKDFLSLVGSKVVAVEVDDLNSDYVMPYLKGVLQLRRCERPLIYSLTRKCVFIKRGSSSDKFAGCKKECLQNKAIVFNTALRKTFMVKENCVVSV